MGAAAGWSGGQDDLDAGFDPAEAAELAEALARIVDRVELACGRARRAAAEVALVGVSKTVSPGRLRAAVAAGIRTLGENRVQEAEHKTALVPAAAWHLIGPLQSNKARRAVATFDVVETVESLDLAVRLDRIAAEVVPGAPLDVLLQANVDDDPAKAGFDPAALRDALPALLALPHLRVGGLMTVGRLTADPQAARATFVALRRLSEVLRTDDERLGPGLSMGMSDDFEIAIEEGATTVRIGRALFGARRAATG